MRLTATVSMPGLDLKIKYLLEGAKTGLKFGVSEAGLLFETAAKQNVPVLTGNLRDHIHTEQVIDEPLRQEVIVTPVVESSNEYGFDPAYARRIELGFVGVDSLGRNYHQAPQPFMRPAFEEQKEAAHETIVRNVKEEVVNASVTRR
jgi:HK97 gp10 family phage protein